jgi:hypothetical protein
MSKYSKRIDVWQPPNKFSNTLSIVNREPLPEREKRLSQALASIGCTINREPLRGVVMPQIVRAA